MMTVLATVMSIYPAAPKGFIVELSCRRKAGCNACSLSGSSCNLFGEQVDKTTLKWEIKTDKNLQEGCAVEVGFPESSLVRSAAYLYFLPLFMMGSGAFLGDAVSRRFFSSNELVVALLAGSLAWLGTILSRHFSKALEKKIYGEVVLVRVLSNHPH